MPIWLTVLLPVLAIVIAAGLAVSLTVQNRMAVRRRVMVNMVDGKAVSGVLWARRGRLLVLKDATLHERGVDSTAVDGEILVDRHRIDFVQVL